MKVLHVIFSFNTGGAELLLIDIINHQINEIEVSLCVINKEYDIDLINQINNRVPVFLLNRKAGSYNPLKIIQLNKIIKKENPDIIHAHNENAAGMMWNSYPKVLTIHDIGSSSNWVNKYNQLYAISKSVQQDILSRNKKEAKLIYNGINICSIKKKNRIDPDNFRIVQLSRLSHKIKGQDILLKSLSIFKKENPDIKFSLDFIGEGDSLEYLSELTSELGLKDSVNFLGNKNRTEIYNMLAEYNLLVQPSICEGFGLTVAEAIAAKLPVLVSDNDGPMEIIENGKYGFYFKKGDENDCAQKIKNIMMMDVEALNELTDRAFEHIQRFDVRTTSKLYIHHYSELLPNFSPHQ